MRQVQGSMKKSRCMPLAMWCWGAEVLRLDRDQLSNEVEREMD